MFLGAISNNWCVYVKLSSVLIVFVFHALKVCLYSIHSQSMSSYYVFKVLAWVYVFYIIYSVLHSLAFRKSC